MVTMMTHKMMDNFSCTLLAKDEPYAGSQACSGGGGNVAGINMQAQSESHLARENALLRQQLLEAAADNDALSNSLQERAQSLADMTDAKINAETEMKVLQVQLKCLQQDIETHKYEVHLLRKQLQIRNEEREQQKKVSDASYKQHLNNTKKIAQLESECQRLRGLVRQRLPGPAAIVQMRAECDMDVRIGMKKSPKILHNSSTAQAQREIEGLKERLLYVEDEAKFLKEAMTKRTAELQDARKLCAKTAMKLSAAQSLLESMSTNMNTEHSVPSTPHLQSEAPSTSHAEDDVLCNSEIESINHANITSDIGEASCAESWAFALFAELSNLSNHQEDTSITKEETNSCKRMDMVTLDGSTSPENDVLSALEKVNCRLSSVRENILTSSLCCSVARGDSNSMTCENPKNEILEEIRQIKCILLAIERAMKTMGSAKYDSVYVNDVENYEVTSNGELIVKEEGHRASVRTPERSLSRLRYSSLKGKDDIFPTFGEESDKLELMGVSKFGEEAAKMEDVGAEVGEETNRMDDMGANSGEATDKLEDLDAKVGGVTEKIEEVGKMESSGPKFGEEGDEMGINLISDQSTEMGTQCREETTAMVDDLPGKMIKNSSCCSGDSRASSTTPRRQLNLAATADIPSLLVGPEESVVAPAEAEGDVELVRLLDSARAELEMARARIATLEAELANSKREKADVAEQLSEARFVQQRLEAQLARSTASLEALKLKLVAATATDQGAVSSVERGSPASLQVDAHANMKEEQELAAARAQLADCQHSIQVIRKQMVLDIQHSPLHDIMSDDQVPFDTSSESPKSVEQTSYVPPSPTTNNLHYFMISSTNNIVTKPMGDASTQQESKSGPFSTSSDSNSSQDECRQPKLLDQHATEDVKQILEDQCKSHDAYSISMPLKMYLKGSPNMGTDSRSSGKLLKIPKSSTVARICEFFKKAKSTR